MDTEAECQIKRMKGPKFTGRIGISTSKDKSHKLLCIVSTFKPNISISPEA
jgi:hypothetical protein